MELLRWCRLQWDRVLAVVAMAGGVVALLLGWAGASHTEYVAKQVPYAVSGGLGCLALLMAGGTLWLSADFRDEWRALDRLEERLGDRLAADPFLEELDRRVAQLEQREPTAPLPSALQETTSFAAGVATGVHAASTSSGLSATVQGSPDGDGKKHR